MNPTTIVKKNCVNENKKVDVNNLLISHYGEEWKNDPRLKFYKLVLDGENQEEDKGNTLCESREEEESSLTV